MMLNRPAIVRLFASICLIMAMACPGWAATYYVTQTAQGTGDGSSYDNSMAVATHNGGSFNPGDIIYLCGAFSSQVAPPSSGDATATIKYISSDDYPCVIDGDYSLTTGFGYTGSIYLDVIGIEVKKCKGEGIRARSAGTSAVGDLYTTIDGCHVHDIGVDATSGNGIDGRGVGLIVTNSTIHDVIFDGVYHQGADCSIYENHIYNVDKTTGTAGGDCVQLSSSCSNTKVYRNIFDHSSKSSKNGLILNDSSATGVEVYENIAIMPAYDGRTTTNIWVSATDAKIYRNHVTNGAAGIYSQNSSGVNAYSNIANGCYTGISLTNAAIGVYNNTVTNCANIGIIGSYDDPTSRINNNVVYNCGTGISKYGSIAEDYNIYFGNTTDRNNIGGTESWGSNSIFDNPLFFNASAKDYRLRFDSPCRWAGTPISGLTTDYAGKHINANFPDIGAYQYQPSICKHIINHHMSKQRIIREVIQ